MALTNEQQMELFRLVTELSVELRQLKKGFEDLHSAMNNGCAFGRETRRRILYVAMLIGASGGIGIGAFKEFVGMMTR
jgi:hypothetical protein